MTCGESSFVRSLGHQSLTPLPEVGPPGADADANAGLGGDGGLDADEGLGAGADSGTGEAVGGPEDMAVPLSAANIPASWPRSRRTSPAYAGGDRRR
jgi:hypothetical protein